MSMYPDESLQDSPAEKRRKIYARLFWVFLVTNLLLAASALYVNFSAAYLPFDNATSEPDLSASPSPSNSETGSASSSAEVEYCNSVVETMPGDLEFVLSLGWEIECVEAGGDPDLGESGVLAEFYTAGYADPSEMRIAIDAPEVTPAIIAHEAAHAIDFELLLQSDKDEIATKYGASSWEEGSDYLNNPNEMFAEARMRCLGYEHDPEYGFMTCEEVDALISGTEKADEINKMANRG